MLKGYFFILILLLLFVSIVVIANEFYDWDEFKVKHLEFITQKNFTSAKKFLEVLPDKELSEKEISAGKEQIELVFKPENFTKLEAIVRKGNLVQFNILYRLYYISDGAYSEYLSILIGSLIESNPKNFLIAAEKNYNIIQLIGGLGPIVGNLGYEYVDKFKQQLSILKKRKKAINNVKIKEDDNISTSIKELCISELDYQINRRKQTISQINNN